MNAPPTRLNWTSRLRRSAANTGGQGGTYHPSPEPSFYRRIRIPGTDDVIVVDVKLRRRFRFSISREAS